VRKIFRDLLHQYRVESFKITHNNENVEDTMRELMKFTDDALNNAYHYHFHKDSEPQRIETFNLIKNYTLESILPPVLEKVMRRVLILEKQHESIVALFDDLLEALSEDDGVQNADRTTVP
jgi:hypothetical protein